MTDSAASIQQPLPTGTVTFLFTDIEGSTRLWQEHRDAMRSALARHHALLQHAIESNCGYVFQIIGDAFCAAFSTASDALAAALAAQRALRDEAWGETGPINVRMAIHIGAAQVRAGDFMSGEYASGITLSRAAQLLSAGHGGQILLSASAAELIREALPPQTDLRDLGTHRLKDLVQPQLIFQAVAPDLPVEFPPLKTLDVLPNNLPIQLTSFIGREKETKELIGLLGRVRLLTLTGTGGAGKTRLSLHIAADVIDGFEHGAWFVDLAPVSDPALVPQTVMNGLDLREEARRAPVDVLADFLRAKELLLVLDNCEHLIQACAQLARHLLTQCPHLKVLATSREALAVPGENIYQVPALSFPDPQRLPPLESLSQYDAVRLFIERATAVQPEFAVTNANAPAVAQICYRLDGIPLAIELAAVRIKLLAPEQIATRLDDRFRLLTGGGRTVLPRQQTLRATIEWSYSLLSASERILFQRLAVFVGGWTIEAAEQVCASDGDGDLGPLDVMDVLARLVDKSLVTTETRDGETRYRMLETIREYAREKLQESGEAGGVQNRHLDFFLKLAEEAETKLEGSEQVRWLNRLEREHDNLRAALAWTRASTGKAELGLRLAGALGEFWASFGSYFHEGREQLSAVLSSNEASGRTTARAKALCEAGKLAYLQSDYPATRSLLEASLSIYRELAPAGRLGLAYALIQLGDMMTAVGDYVTARSLMKEGLSIMRELKNVRGIAYALWQLGYCAARPGDYRQAAQYFEEALPLLRQLGNKDDTAVALTGLAEIALRQGDYEHAIMLEEESLGLRREIGIKWGIAVSLGNFGWIALRRADLEQAMTMLEESLTLRREIGDRGGIAWCLEKFAEVALMQGQQESSPPRSEEFRRAARLFGAAGALRAPIGSVIDLVDQPEYESQLAILRAQLDGATFEAEWEGGSAMTLEQAIEYALEAALAPVEATRPSHLLTPRQAARQEFGGLTEREREVAVLIARGESNREIAAELVISERTVESHVGNILNKLAFGARAEIRKWAKEKGLLKRDR